MKGLLFFERCVLEAIVRHPALPSCLIEDVSGYNGTYVALAIANLRRLALIEKIAGVYYATERGKIALAIIVGKETRARSRQRSAA